MGKKKVASRGKASPTKKKKSQSAGAMGASRSSIEQVLSQLFGPSGRNSPADAQELAFEAMEVAGEGHERQAIELARKSIALDPNCVDALLLLAEAECDTVSQMIERLRKIVQVGEHSLGAKFFRENRGYFWGILETRPYMRARAYLAELLVQTGQLDEAMAHYEAMLVLNPNDNQGLREVLLGLYFQTSRLQGVSKLFQEYPDDGSAVFAWSRVLEQLLRENHSGALQALIAARDDNPHVEPLLTGRKRMPRELPGFYSPGEVSEAVVCVAMIGAGWKQHKSALAWLKAQSGKQ